MMRNLSHQPPYLSPEDEAYLAARAVPLPLALKAEVSSVYGFESLAFEWELRFEGGALCVPYFSKGDLITSRVRPHQRAASGPKWLTPRGRPVLPWIPPARVVDPAVWKDISRPVSFTESPIKALALCAAGYPAIGLAGASAGAHDAAAWNHGEGELLPHPELARVKWRGRLVPLLLDAGRAKNPAVAHSEAVASFVLRSLGAEVRLVALPFRDDGADQGPDDFLATHGKEPLQRLLDAALPGDPVARAVDLDKNKDPAARALAVDGLLSDKPWLASLRLERGRWDSVAAILGIPKKRIEAAVDRFAAELAAKREDDDPRPKIFYTTELYQVVDAAVAALAKDPTVFQRAEALVSFRQGVKPPDWLDREIEAPVIRDVSLAGLRERLSRVARFRKHDKRAGGPVSILPPDPVLQAVEARGEWRGIRPLYGLSEAPFLRPDGSICQEPGYDPKTGYLYVPNAEYPSVPEAPTRGDAEAALKALLEVFCDFPFVNEAHRAGCLALPLTLAARPGIGGCCPLFAFDAATRGTGKSLSTDAAALMIYGRPAPRMTQPDTEDELRKRITSLLLDGERLALLDNVDRPLGGASLDALLTGHSWQDRILGRLQTVTLPALTVWATTGNNLQFSGDTIRRILHIRMESPLESPEDRDPRSFKHPDLLAWVRAERPRLAVAALTVLRAWVVAGRPTPQGMRLWGSFEAWSRLLPPALVWLGMPDPIEAHRELAAKQDHQKSALGAFLQELQELLTRKGKADFSAREILEATLDPASPPTLKEAVDALVSSKGGKAITAQALGAALRKHKNRWVGGRALDCEANPKTKIVRWLLRVLAGIGGYRPSPHPGE